MRPALALALCAVLACPATAQEADPKAEQEAALEAEAAEFFKTYDADADGKVTLAEVRKATAAELGEGAEDFTIAVEAGETYCLCVAADTDDDGLLSKDEYRALRRKKIADPKYKPPLSRADIEVLKKEVYAPVLKYLLDEADKDKDGKLSEKEYTGATGGAAEFISADKDLNGYLTRAELEAEWVKGLGADFELPKDPAAAIAAPYGRVGRNWTLKHTSRVGKAETVSYSRTEVIALTDKEATVKVQKLDKDKKPIEGGLTEEKVALPPAAPPKDAGTETIKTAAGEFECAVVETTTAAGTRKQWFSRAHPGLCVKATFKDDLAEITTELAEFVE